jgi:hypothetical protein
MSGLRSLIPLAVPCVTYKSWTSRASTGLPECGVGAGARVVSEAAKNDNVKRIVGATVTTTIEPVSVGASAAGGDRRGAAEVRESGFGVDPVKVVAGADGHLAGDLGSNSGMGKQGGGDLVQELMRLLVGFGDLLWSC